MRRSTRSAAVLTGIVLAGTAWSSTGARQRDAGQLSVVESRGGDHPTFNADVARVLYTHCAPCHRPGELAPMPLLTFEEAKRVAPAIKRVVQTREMPPWYADRQHGTFRNQRGLTDAQIATLVGWVDGGTPQGAGAAPVPPAFGAMGWNAGMGRPPDQILELPSGFALPPSGIVPVFRLWIDPRIREEQFIQAIEIRPTNRHVVHHSSLSAVPLPAGTTLGQGELWPKGPIFDGVPVHADGQPFRASSPQEFGKPLLFYVPGGGFMQFPDGLGKRLAPRDHLVWELHLMTTGKPEQTDIRIGIWYSRVPVHHEILTWTVNERLIANGKEVTVDAAGAEQLPNIPAHAADWALTGVLKLKDDVTLYALWPHMHFRGKAMRFVLTAPDGREETLLSVPHYHPHWQITYELTAPRRIKAGSTITAYGRYDNSAGNHHNPDPTVEVLFGEQGHNEMFLPFIEVTID